MSADQLDPEALLAFWFGEQSDGFAGEQARNRWFAGGEQFDELCRSRYADAPGQAAAGDLDAWLKTPRGRLAFILSCDQLPRNLYRGSARAFATDRLALDAARDGINGGADRSLTWDERCFFYLPFEHSENLLDQHTCVGLFSMLRDETPAGAKHLTGEYLRHAHQHRDVILRFGRFPHRNAAMERRSSAAELEYLETGSHFGQ